MADPVSRERSEERELAAWLRAGRPEALGEVHRLHGRALFAVALRLTGSRADAEDVVQDLLVGLPEAVKGWQARGSLRSWLKRAAARSALIRLRRRRERFELLERAVAGLEVLPAMGRPNPPPSLETERLTAAVAALREDLRVAFVLKEVEGYTHAEISGMLGISVSVSKVRLHRAKKKLQETLEERE